VPLKSLHAIELERRIREDIYSLRDLVRKNRAEADELIAKFKNGLRSIRPDLFQPVQTTTTEPERESK